MPAKFTWRPHIYEADVYVIGRDKKWFAVVHLNGEYLAIRQERYMTLITKALNVLSWLKLI